MSLNLHQEDSSVEECQGAPEILYPFDLGRFSSLCLSGGALGLVMAAGSVGKAASSLMELQNNGGYFLHHVIFASFAVLSVLCIMLLPESKRKALADSMKDGENLRRPSLFQSPKDRDDLPLLSRRPPTSQYNPENYSRLLSATRKMLSKDIVSSQQTLLNGDGAAQDGSDVQS